MHNDSAIAEEVNIHPDLRGRYCRVFSRTHRIDNSGNFDMRGFTT